MYYLKTAILHEQCTNYITCYHWSHELRPKKLSVRLAVPPAPVWVRRQRTLVKSVVSVTSVANDKGDNEMILGAVHRSHGICLTAVENPIKPQLENVKLLEKQ